MILINYIFNSLINLIYIFIHMLIIKIKERSLILMELLLE